MARTETRFRGSRLVTVGENARSSPSSLPRIGRNAQTPRTTTCAGAKPPGERPIGLVRRPESPFEPFGYLDRVMATAARSPRVLRHAQASGWRSSEEGDRSSGCHARVRSVSEPRRRIPASCPFLRVAVRRQIRASIGCSGHFGRSSGSLDDPEANDRSNHAYGISCRTRPTLTFSGQGPMGQNRYRVGRDLDVPNNSDVSLQSRRARPEKWPDLG